jgi:hypothetical protein
MLKILIPVRAKYLTFGSGITASYVILHSAHPYTYVATVVHPQNLRFQNVRFTKRQVYKMSGLQNVRSSKRPVAKKNSYIFCTCGRWKSAGSVAAMFAGKVMDVFYSLFRGFLPYITIINNNDTLFTLNRNANLEIPILFV